jgi:hypothetical protein
LNVTKNRYVLKLCWITFEALILCFSTAFF